MCYEPHKFHHPEFHRWLHFPTKQEGTESLEKYIEELEKELAAAKERLAELKKK